MKAIFIMYFSGILYVIITKPRTEYKLIMRWEMKKYEEKDKTEIAECVFVLVTISMSLMCSARFFSLFCSPLPSVCPDSILVKMDFQ